MKFTDQQAQSHLAMAPRKRTRSIDDIDGGTEIESASSSLRYASSKRSRVALARENGGSVVSDDEDGDSSSDEARRRSMRQGSEDDEINELQATQLLTKEINRYRDNRASEQGVIEEVYCRNFMCHSKLRIKLGPLINFIIGHNGSGKSAVLTALTMCLGGKATSTNRGAALKNLIKEGEENATLAVKIKNQGEGAYKPELYGASITVERNFSRSGVSGFKIKNAQDKIISTKKTDLDDILDFFAFQLDNPINVLTQDMARQFLSNSTPSDKYKFFIRGTQLEVLDADYKLLEEHLDSIVVKLHSREQDIHVLKTNMEAAEERKQRLERTNVIKSRIKDMQRMHAWAQVEQQEQDLKQCEKRITEAEQATQEVRSAAEECDGVYEGCNQSWEAAKRSLSDMQEQVEPLKLRHRKEKDDFDKNTKELLNVKAEERQIKESMQKGKSDVNKLKASIKAEQDRLAAAEGPEHVERLQRLEALQEDAEQAKRDQTEHNTGLAGLDKVKAEAAHQYSGAKPELERRRDDLKKANNKLVTAQENQPRPFSGYRPNMEKLVRAVNNETRWRSKPVGPMGKYVKLLKQEWSSQIERTFGGVLDSFVVTSKEDADRLTRLMKSVNCTPNVLIGSAQPLNVHGNEPPGDVLTILRVLDIDSDVVRNQLIINQAIEQTVLIASRADAYSYAYEGQRPANVRAIICKDDRDKNKGLRFEWSRSGAPKTSPVYRWDEPRMQINREDQIASYRDEVEHARTAVHAEETRLSQLRKDAEDANKAVVRFQRQQKDLVIASQQAEDAVAALQNEIETSRPQDGKFQELERQLASAKGDLEADEESFKDMVIEKDRLGGIGKELKARVDAEQAELDQAEARVTEADNRVQRCASSREHALREKNRAHGRIDDAERNERDLEQARVTQEAQVKDFCAQAEQVWSRVPVDPDFNVEAIDARIEKLSEDLKRAHREAGGTPEELLAAFFEAKRTHDEAMAVMKDMTGVAKVCDVWSHVTSSTDHAYSNYEIHSRTVTSGGRCSASSSQLEPVQCSPISSASERSVVGCYSIISKSCLISKSSLISPSHPTPAALRKRSRAVRNLSRLSACCLASGKQWGRQSAVWMNSMFSWTVSIVRRV